MPEVNFKIRWSDGKEEACYSPSTIIKQYLTEDMTYPLDDFLERVRIGLNKASLRVEKVYGYRCTSADAQLSKIEKRAASLDPNLKFAVTCVSID